MAEAAAKKVAVRNEVAEVEAMLKEVEVGEPAVAGSSVVAVREVAADSVAGSHLGSRQAARNVAPPARLHWVVVLAGLVLGRVPGREAQDEQVSAPVAQVSRVLERAARVALEPVRVELEAGCSAAGAGRPGVGVGGAGQPGAGAGGAGRPGVGAVELEDRVQV